ncbi:MAG: S9 family peptidase [Deltaproteobacteria bacterium]|nr:S9 family peptidase [Deltaproteobacteria bacterium]
MTICRAGNRAFSLAVVFAIWGWLIAGVSVADEGTYSIEQYLNIRSTKGGSWSPDGRRVVYLTNVSGTDQVWQVPSSGGNTRQLTDGKERVAFAEYSPTQDVIAFGMDEGGNERTQIYLMNGDGTGIRPLTQNPKVIHTFGAWSHDGRYIAYASNERDERWFDVYVMEVATGKARRVFEQDGMNEVAAWSWNDRYLVVTNWESNLNNNLYLVELESLKDRHLTPHTGYATYTQVVWPFESKNFYVVSNLTQDWSKLALFRLRRGIVDFLDAAMWDTEALTISRDGKFMAYSLNVNGYSKPFLVDIDRQKTFGQIPLTGGVVNRFAFSPDAKKLLYSFTSPTAPSDLWVFDIASGTNRRLTTSDTAGIDPASFVEPEFLKYPGHGSFVVPAYFYRPRDAQRDGNGAALVYAHGGPEAQERPTFSPLFQYFLSRGVSIFAANVRGSAGYGKTYLTLDDKRNRMNSLRDYALGAEYLKKSGWIHEKRIGVIGGSYGGWVVLAGLTEYPNLWAAGVSIVGISNFETFLEKTGSWRRPLREAEYGSLANDREFLVSISPVHKADRIAAPLMVIQGANDPRVPTNEAEQMVAAVKANGRDVEYLLYADEGHGLTKLKNRLDAYPKMADFLRRHLLRPATATEKPAAN